ncbi:MAG: M15 family metallopeptidase [Spirochaetaceae bacterium]|nr:M15 family metallopeptidase [Spirochaetaceae bacterium]
MHLSVTTRTLSGIPILFAALLAVASAQAPRSQTQSRQLPFGAEIQAEVSAQNRQQDPAFAERVMRAFAAAYPGRLGEPVFRGSDWAVSLGGIVYYFAGGRMLREPLLSRADEFLPHSFYPYPAELPEWKSPTAEQNERFRTIRERRQIQTLKHSQDFFDDLWGIHNHAQGSARMQRMDFLGKKLIVHYSIMEEIALVEMRILEAAKTNAAVRAWIQGLQSATGWNWRNIAETASRSYHSYGAAVDVLSKPERGKETYWLWTAQKNMDWWAVPYSRRQHPPQEVIKAFEAYGFTWGGKWLVYDTMHFEYRPEILILNGLPVLRE